ncbi:MAG: hypothetical protein V8S77_09165 [Oscillospiraceae bacterium]
MPSWRWRATSTPWQAGVPSWRRDRSRIWSAAGRWRTRCVHLLQELRELGMTEGEWIALWRGGNENA